MVWGAASGVHCSESWLFLVSPAPCVLCFSFSAALGNQFLNSHTPLLLQSSDNLFSPALNPPSGTAALLLLTCSAAASQGVTQQQPHVEELEDLIPITAPTCPAMVWIQPGLVQGGPGGESQNHRIFQFRLEKPSKIINSNHQPSTAKHNLQGCRMAAEHPHFTHPAAGRAVLTHPSMREGICSLLALGRCQHRCHSKVTPELAGQHGSAVSHPWLCQSSSHGTWGRQWHSG